MAPLCYRRHRFPPTIIQHAIWLYLAPPLRDQWFANSLRTSGSARIDRALRPYHIVPRLLATQAHTPECLGVTGG
jgi:hypothetical protein